MKNLILLFFSIAILSCSQDQDGIIDRSLPLFEMRSSETTGLTFVNQVDETLTQNLMSYQYYYNGAGIAIGDFSGDGLPDLFFLSNRKDNAFYLNEGNLKFSDKSAVSKLKGTPGFYSGVTTVDINGDGKLDIYACKTGKYRNPDDRCNELYINQGNKNGTPVFTQEAKKYNLDIPEYSNQAAFLDFDKDGDLDMFLLNHNVQFYNEKSKIDSLLRAKNKNGDRLFRNDGGKYIDISESAGMISRATSFGLGVSIGDVNGDGYPDIYSAQDYADYDRLYLNQKNGTYQEVINVATGQISLFSMGTDMADMNNDGWLDLMTVDMVAEDNYGIKANMSAMNPDQFHAQVNRGLHHQYMFNALQMNNGTTINSDIPYFSNVAQMSGISNTDWSWGPLLFDMNNDGNRDVFISNGIKRNPKNVDATIAQEPIVKHYENRKMDEVYVREMISVLPSNEKPNYFYLNDGELNFRKINDEIKGGNLPTLSNGAAYGDLDNDGDLDLVFNNMNSSALIYENHARQSNQNNYLKIKFDGSKKNRNGLGARVIIETNTGEKIAENYVSRGFLSASEGGIHFGLGSDNNVLKLKVYWPDGKYQELNNVSVNQTLLLKHSEANINQSYQTTKNVLVSETTIKGLNFRHQENNFDDYEREVLLPYELSHEGPAMEIGDMNGDGNDDLFIGGANGQPSSLLLSQDETMQFSNQALFLDHADFEDVAAHLFDVDGDGDLDLYVGSGGNEHIAKSKLYKDRLYLNDGTGRLSFISNALPEIYSSTGDIVSHDIDNDGDLDLMVSSFQYPGKYPHPVETYILRNDSKGSSVSFKNVTQNLTSEFQEIGMIKEISWANLDGDSEMELITAGEWTSIRIWDVKDGKLIEKKGTNLNDHIGWWNVVKTIDVDGDGDLDMIAGNLGKNSKYKASPEAPFSIYLSDFDNSGKEDIVLSYRQEGEEYPLRGRQCSSQQIPSIKNKFPNYKSFASADIADIYGQEALNNALQYHATNFAHMLFINDGNGNFTGSELPSWAQISTVNDILITDLNKDGHQDLILGGNKLQIEVETPRTDGSLGLVLLGDSKGTFRPLPTSQSGLKITGEIKKLGLITIDYNEYIIAGRNDAPISIFKVK